MRPGHLGGDGQPFPGNGDIRDVRQASEQGKQAALRDRAPLGEGDLQVVGM